jgi:hypothetical protein
MRTIPIFESYNPNTGTTGTWRQGSSNIAATFSGQGSCGAIISNNAVVVANNGMVIHATATAELLY